MTDSSPERNPVNTPDAGLACLAALGEAYRGDWSDFDGRQLRSELEEVAEIIRQESRGEDVKRAVAGFYAGHGICSRCQSWTAHCCCEASA